LAGHSARIDPAAKFLILEAVASFPRMLSLNTEIAYSMCRFADVSASSLRKDHQLPYSAFAKGLTSEQIDRH
jgi:hypothetical protein